MSPLHVCSSSCSCLAWPTLLGGGGGEEVGGQYNNRFKVYYFATHTCAYLYKIFVELFATPTDSCSDQNQSEPLLLAFDIIYDIVHTC